MSCCPKKPEVEDIASNVKNYYGKILTGTQDLKTSACCLDGDKPPTRITQALANVHSEVKSRFYGCGITFPEDSLEGLNILDLGSGSGQDCFIAAQLVGPKGSVVGIDMTPEQLDVARKYIPYHQKLIEKQHGSAPDIKFHMGYIENLSAGEAQLPNDSFDLIISNCVVNLSSDKEAVLREAYRVLKAGGEMYFSDVYADRRVPVELTKDPILLGECLSGALYWGDFQRLCRKVGLTDARLVTDRQITFDENSEDSRNISKKIGNIRFFSATYRLWKLPGLEDDCEDYGQGVIYKGTIPGLEHSYKLDAGHEFPTGKLVLVCENSYRMIADTRLASHFQLISPEPRTHFGIFEGCGSGLPFKNLDAGATTKSSPSCC